MSQSTEEEVFEASDDMETEEQQNEADNSKLQSPFLDTEEQHTEE